VTAPGTRVPPGHGADPFDAQGLWRRVALDSEAPVSVALSPELSARRARLRRIVGSIVAVAAVGSAGVLARLSFADHAPSIESVAYVSEAAAAPAPPAEPAAAREADPAPSAPPAQPLPPRRPAASHARAPIRTDGHSTVAVDPVPDGYRPPTARFTD
jgi:hypothetical protein